MGKLNLLKEDAKFRPLQDSQRDIFKPTHSRSFGPACQRKI